jgi:hypothetical protein
MVCIYIFSTPFSFPFPRPPPSTLVLLPEMIPSLSNPLLFYTTFLEHEGLKALRNVKFIRSPDLLSPLIWLWLDDADIQNDCYIFIN